jgi:ssDNA-binding Zn-finger/Zn-ribbon topoisomerase 1
MEATLQGIFKAGFTHYREQHGLSMDQYQAAQAIMSCQSEALGYEEWQCLDDGHTERLNHSCRHRSCPRCNQALTHDWLEKTKTRLLPCDHYHVVFTLPHELNPIWHYNRHWCSDHLFKASSETLQQLLKDERFLGAQVGMLSSLHTWGRTLSFHPHVHVLVTGGGLSGKTWRGLEKDFLLPVGVLKAKFRGKWLAWLNRAYTNGEIRLPPDWSERSWKKTLSQIAKKNWNVRIQGAYRHGYGVAVYLSRYVRGGPIKDGRLAKGDDTSVTFRYRAHPDNKEQLHQLSIDHFITRVLWHVPVKGQHTVRYYGLYVPGARDKRDLIRMQLGEKQGENAPNKTVKQRQCPECGRPLLHRLSARRKISCIKSTNAQEPVQQGVGVDRDAASRRQDWYIYKPPPDFFASCGGNST